MEDEHSMMASTVIVIASRGDGAGREFVERYAAAGARLMTPKDLSVVGWRHRPGTIDTSTAVVAGQPLARGDITGVITRLAFVAEYELDHIISADRTYVAAEMTALLRCWLAELPCPILNPPTPNCLSGPYWSHAKWVLTASRLGLPITPVCRRLTQSATLATMSEVQTTAIAVTVVGSRCFGDVHPTLGQQARQLADAASVDLLTVYFSGFEPGSRFVRADLWPDMTQDEVASAIFAYVGGEP
jgi:hypothetical protein